MGGLGTGGHGVLSSIVEGWGRAGQGGQGGAGRGQQGPSGRRLCPPFLASPPQRQHGLKFVFVGITDNDNCRAARDVFSKEDISGHPKKYAAALGPRSGRGVCASHALRMSHERPALVRAPAPTAIHWHRLSRAVRSSRPMGRSCGDGESGARQWWGCASQDALSVGWQGFVRAPLTISREFAESCDLIYGTGFRLADLRGLWMEAENPVRNCCV